MISLVALRWTLSIKSIKNCWCGDQTWEANSTCGLTKWMYSLSSTWGWVQVPQVLLFKRRTLLAVFTLAMIWLSQDRLWLINTPHKRKSHQKKASQASTRRREVICDHDCSRRVDFQNTILLPRGLTPYPFINHFWTIVVLWDPCLCMKSTPPPGLWVFQQCLANYLR